MGTYDAIYMLTDQVSCGEGHVQTGELQTKDLLEGQGTYLVWGGNLYSGRPHADLLTDWSYKLDGEVLIARRTDRIPIYTYTGSFRAYRSCNQCRPIVARSGKAKLGMADHYHLWSPWLEWEFQFTDGKLVDTRPVKVQSRDDLREELTKEIGLHVLPDGDDRAIFHLMRLAEYERGPWWPEEWDNGRRRQ